MVNELLLLSGSDIPFPEAGITIHPPTIKEISYIGEEPFFIGCELLNFSKDILDDKDKSRLEQLTNFEILMSIMNDNNPALKRQKYCVLMVLSLIFPKYQISLSVDKIRLVEIDEKGFFEEEHAIDKNNFENFKIILKEMFCLNRGGSDDFNPNGDLSKKIADKLKQRQKKLAEQKSGSQKVAILSRYISILTVGQKKDMNSLLGYTVFQLFDEYRRFELKLQADIYLKATLAGAKDLKEVEDWMKDIHSDST